MCSYLLYRKLRTSVAGQMVLNITIALMGHHATLLPQKIILVSTSQLPAEICSLYTTLIVYFGTVLMFLFAAEAVNMFLSIVIVFTKINQYVIKATVIAWSK